MQCGECLMEHVKLVELVNHVCPECGADYRTRLELFYGFVRGIDGHGGPYYDLEQATTAADARLRGCPTMLYVEIRQSTPDGGWKLIQKLSKSAAAV